MILLRKFAFFFKQKKAYAMRICDWSSDVCSSDLAITGHPERVEQPVQAQTRPHGRRLQRRLRFRRAAPPPARDPCDQQPAGVQLRLGNFRLKPACPTSVPTRSLSRRAPARPPRARRSEEHTSELQSLMRISSALFS